MVFQKGNTLGRLRKNRLVGENNPAKRQEVSYRSIWNILAYRTSKNIYRYRSRKN